MFEKVALHQAHLQPYTCMLEDMFELESELEDSVWEASISGSMWSGKGFGEQSIRGCHIDATISLISELCNLKSSRSTHDVLLRRLPIRQRPVPEIFRAPAGLSTVSRERPYLISHSTPHSASSAPPGAVQLHHHAQTTHNDSLHPE